MEVGAIICLGFRGGVAGDFDKNRGDPFLKKRCMPIFWKWVVQACTGVGTGNFIIRVV